MNTFFNESDFAYGLERKIDDRSKIHANYANYKLLMFGKIVFGTNSLDVWSQREHENDTQTALLVNITPIIPKTREQRLEELLVMFIQKAKNQDDLTNEILKAEKELGHEWTKQPLQPL